MSWALFQNSLVFSLVATTVAVLAGLVAALFLTGVAPGVRLGGMGLAVVALALPPFLVVNCWLDLLGTNGLWHRWLPFTVYQLPVAAVLMALMLWPIPMLAVLGEWGKLEPWQLEVEDELRGTPLVTGLLLPAAGPALGFAGLLVFVLALNQFTIPAILQVRVFTAEVWMRFSTNLDFSGAWAASVPLVVAPLVILLAMRHRAVTWPRWEGGVPAGLMRERLGKAWFLGGGLGVIVLGVVAVGIPLVHLLGSRRTWVDLPSAIAAGLRPATTSFVVALAVAVLTMALGVVFRARSLGILIGLFFLTPGILLGLSLVWLLNRPLFQAVYPSVGVMILALVLRYLAVGWAAASTAARSLDRALVDAARLEGASRWQRFRHVFWPQSALLLVGLGYVVYVLCLWDVETLLLILPPGDETLAVRVFNLLHYGHNSQVNALCLALLFLALAPLIGFVVVRAGLFRGRGRATRAGGGRLWRTACSLLSSTGRMNHVAADVSRRCRSAARGTRQRGRTSAATDGRGGVMRSGEFPFEVHSDHEPRSCRHESALPIRGEGRQAARTDVRGYGRQGRAWRVATALSVGLALGVAGCVPSEPGRTRLESRFFDRVEVIGERGTGPGQFNKPRTVALDAADNLYVVDMTGRVQKLDPQGRHLLTWQMPQTDLGRPKGMGIDAEGHLIVLEPHYSRVNHYDGLGRLVRRWGQHGTNDGELSFPRAVAVNSQGEMWISEYGRVDRVQRFTRDGTRRVVGVGQFGDGLGEFNRPEGLGLDADGNLYVADSCNHRIQVGDSEGKNWRQFGRSGSGPGELSYPYDVRGDGSGLVFVCEFGNSRVQVFDREGRSQDIVGGPGSEPGRFSNPWSLALDSRGNLYVADAGNHRVQKLIRRRRTCRGRLAQARRRGI